MHDLRALRINPADFGSEMYRRGISHQDVLKLFEADRLNREAIQENQVFTSEQNLLSKRIGEDTRRGSDTSELKEQAQAVKTLSEKAGGRVVKTSQDLLEQLYSFPNALDLDVPDGPDESHNEPKKLWGQQPKFDFIPKQHFEIGEALGFMDFGAAAKISGSRFTVLKGSLAKLERALGQFMLDLHVNEHGYIEVSPPLLVNRNALIGTGQIPKLEEDLFKTIDNRYLIPTSEVPLTNLVAGEILPLADLPLRFTALTPCFRSEAGSAGRDTRGMLRQHQFWKVEMVSVMHPENSRAEHERMTRCAEAVLERLELPYRRMLLCAGDTGFSAAKTYDLEVWLPGQGMYREISSCSNCRAFQARRMNARYRKADGKPDFVHTLNGSGVAVGRALIAVLENYQNADGSVTVPEMLRPYMNGLETIR